MQRKHVQTSLEVLKLEQSTREQTAAMLDEREAIRELITIKYGQDEASAKVAKFVYKLSETLYLLYTFVDNFLLVFNNL